MKLLQQSQQGAAAQSSPGWSGAPAPQLPKSAKGLSLLELQQEAERQLHKQQQRAQHQQRDRVVSGGNAVRTALLKGQASISWGFLGGFGSH